MVWKLFYMVLAISVCLLAYGVYLVALARTDPAAFAETAENLTPAPEPEARAP